RQVEFEIHGVPPNSRVRLRRADSEHGNTLAAYQKIGGPQYPTQAQVGELNRVAEDMSVESMRLSKGVIDLQLPVNGVLLLEVSEKGH
ncbi:MAG: glycosyl hydrolase family 39, partial [Terriglobales bacterium]